MSNGMMKEISLQLQAIK